MALRSAFLHELTGTRLVRDALLTKHVFDPVNRTCTGAIYARDGSLVIDSLRPVITHLRPIDPVTIDRSTIDLTSATHIQTGIFGGRILFSWGHVLLETISTASAPPDDLSIPVVYQFFERADINRFKAFITHITPVLKAAWGDREIIVTQGPVLFEMAFVPSPQMTFGRVDQMDGATRIIYDRIRRALGSNVHQNKRLILKRQEHHRRYHEHETEVCAALAADFEIVEVEKMSAQQQISSFSQASLLIGFSGSSLHNALFMPRGATVMEIGDTPVNKPNRVQTEICKLFEQRHLFVPGYTGTKTISAEQIVDNIYREISASRSQRVE